MRTTRTLTLTGGLFLAASLALTACGSSGHSAASGTPNTQDQLLSYAQCLRSHGIQVPDPDPGNPGQLQIPKSAMTDPTKLAAAEQSCRKYGGKFVSGGNSAASSDRAVKLAECLRKRGIPVADPAPGQNITLPHGYSVQKAATAILACRGPGG
jgi:hypothetical protein